MSFSDWWDDWGEISLLAGGCVVLGGLAIGLWRYSTKSERERKKAASSTEVNSIDSLASTSGAASKKDYTLSSEELKRITDSIQISALKDTIPMMTYRGVAVDSVKTFYNAKLIGVDAQAIQYYNENRYESYSVKSLLFELDSDKIVNLVSFDNPYYVNQRYDIQYHPFKSGVSINERQLIGFFEGKLEIKDPPDMRLFKTKANAPKLKDLGHDYSQSYDGVLINSMMNRRDR